MTTSSRNPAIRNMIKTDGEEETKAYVKKHYNIPEHINDWKTIDDMAYASQKKQNDEWNAHREAAEKLKRK